MASRPVFDAAAIRKNSVMAPAPELVLGDKVLGTAYDVVKELLLHLQKIEELNSSINNIHHLIPLLDSITISGSKGVGGGGLLADNPEMILDLESLPVHDGEIDGAQDLVPIRINAEGEERSVTVDKLRAKVTAALAALIGVDVNSADLGTFTGAALPDGVTVKQALQSLANYTETGFSTRDAALPATVNAAVQDAVEDVTDMVTWLEATVNELNATVGGLAGDNGDLGTVIANLTTLSSNLSASLTSLQTTVSNHTNTLALLSDDVFARAAGWLVELLSSRVGDAEGNLDNQMLLIDYLTEAMEAKADISTLLELINHLAEAEGAWDAAKDMLEQLQEELGTLSGEISAFFGGSVNTALRDLEEKLKKISTHAMFEGALAHTERREIVAQQNTDRAAFTEEIQTVVAENAALATRTTTLEATTAATNASLGTLETAMSTADEALSSRITTFEAEMDTALGTVSSSIETVEAAYVAADNALAAQIATFSTSLAGKANVTTVAALSSEVSDLDGVVTAQGLAITSINAALPGKASAAALSSLSATVTEIDGQVNSVSEAITDIMAGQTDGDVASVRVRMAAQTAPSGVSARYGVEVKATAGGTFQTAGFYMDVLSGGTSRVAFQTEKFFIYNGASPVAPFIVSGGYVFMNEVYMNAAYISGALTAGQINVTSLYALSGTLGAVNISSAVLGSLSIGTGNLTSNSVSVTTESDTTTSTFANASAWTTIGSASINWLTSADNKATVFWQFKSMENMTYDIKVLFNGVQIGYMRRYRGGTELPTSGFASGVVSGSSGTFTVQIQRVESGANTEIKACGIYVEVKKK